MPDLPDRKTLEGMKRVDLQRLCKDRGLRANLKSESLIDLLLEATKPSSSSQLPRPTRTSSMRIISKSSSGTRQRGFSSSSIIIHDTDEEAEPDDAPPETAGSSQPERDPSVPPPQSSAPLRAPRKAKDSQYKLGVGRPVLAGGSGARTVTRTGSISKPKRAKAPSTSVKPTEEAIQEVDEELEDQQPGPSNPALGRYGNALGLGQPQAGPSGTSYDDPIPTQRDDPQVQPTVLNPVANLDGLRAAIEEMILPIRDQIQTLNTNFDEVARNAAEASSLRSQVASLTNEVTALRLQASRSAQLEAEVKMLRDDIATIRESNSLGSSHIRTESSQTKSSTTSQVLPSSSSSLLGKRHRSPNDSNITGVMEAGEEIDENELAGQVLRPSKKRAKLSVDEVMAGSSRAGSFQPRTPPGRGTDTSLAGAPTSEQGFTIYSGPEVIEDDVDDPPPPTTRLSEFFATPEASGALSGEAGASTARHAFTFTFPDPGFHPVTSTPAANAGPGAGPMPTSTSIPRPEAPTSPTPSPERAGRRSGHAFGSPLLHSPVRQPRGRHPSVPPAASGSSIQTPDQTPQYISPADLMTPPQPSAEPSRGSSTMLGVGMGRPRSSAVGMSSGMVALPVPMPPDTPAPPMKRTMYGTELDADSRFGDFGEDKIAMGFWTGVPPRF
ncbi:hypothetical protein BXZ70DRAFT_938039 [Cristinia sonorae]|uniref:Uncharacterized protein n=1 Tax=Cristinia sonorae TaxID=1940300 RepID=A0A8K0UPM6_9AGAR|nr:hypothetical protein BXZ70DRAFT_938039 [Cristinia sonorae]